jgi:hypothetical protein
MQHPQRWQASSALLLIGLLHGCEWLDSRGGAAAAGEASDVVPGEVWNGLGPGVVDLMRSRQADALVIRVPEDAELRERLAQRLQRLVSNLEAVWFRTEEHAWTEMDEGYRRRLTRCLCKAVFVCGPAEPGQGAGLMLLDPDGRLLAKGPLDDTDSDRLLHSFEALLNLEPFANRRIERITPAVRAASRAALVPPAPGKPAPAEVDPKLRASCWAAAPWLVDQPDENGWEIGWLGALQSDLEGAGEAYGSPPVLFGVKVRLELEVDGCALCGMSYMFEYLRHFEGFTWD